MKSVLEPFYTEPADMLIVGGGIVGAGVARDAAMRGLRVVLVERQDFAAGTSSRSSRLLHGGLRYLAQGRLGLVREASVEKMILHRIAPHLSWPLPFLFPTWKDTPWRRWRLSVGVRIYDLLCGGDNLGASSTLSREAMLQRLPGLKAEGLTGGVRYFDGFTNDARLVIDTLQAAAQHGAALANYTAFESADRERGFWRCRVRDAGSGEAVTLLARVVVNAAGPWGAHFPQSRLRLRLTKGIHVVVERSRLPVPEAVVLSEGRRILFAIPWGERVILGTTDTDYTGDPAEVRCSAADIAYVLAVVNAAFPEARLKEQDLVSLWSGVRPLIAPRRAAVDAPSDISRRHRIEMTEPGWFDVAGGKLTTYRLMAEQTVDRAARYLRLTLPPCATASTPIPGPYPPPHSGVLPPAVTQEVVRECCRHEWVRRLDDVMLRRTSWHFYHSGARDIAEQISFWLRDELGWSETERLRQIDHYLRAAEFPSRQGCSR